jgi:hypothetical protein
MIANTQVSQEATYLPPSYGPVHTYTVFMPADMHVKINLLPGRPVRSIVSSFCQDNSQKNGSRARIERHPRWKSTTVHPSGKSSAVLLVLPRRRIEAAGMVPKPPPFLYRQPGDVIARHAWIDEPS